MHCLDIFSNDFIDFDLCTIRSVGLAIPYLSMSRLSSRSAKCTLGSNSWIREEGLLLPRSNSKSSEISCKTGELAVLKVGLSLNRTSPDDSFLATCRWYLIWSETKVGIRDDVILYLKVLSNLSFYFSRSNWYWVAPDLKTPLALD